MPSLRDITSYSFPNVSGFTVSVMRALPGVAKVGAMAGSAAFLGKKTAEYILRTEEDGLDTTLGITLAVVFGLSVGYTNYITRFNSMYRRAAKHDELIPAPSPEIDIEPGLNSPQNQQLISHPHRVPTWLSAGIPNRKINPAYIMYCSVGGIIYAAFSFTSGDLAAFSESELIARIPGLSFDSSCGPNKSPAWKIYVAHGVAAFFGFASVYSFLKYNMVRIREYFRDLIILDGYKKISYGTWSVVGLGVGAATTAVYFYNHNTFDNLNEKTFCHLHVAVPENMIQGLTYVTCLTNFLINGLMNLGASHKRNSKQHKNALKSYLDKIPQYSMNRHHLFLLTSSLSSLSTAIGTYLSVVTMPSGKINPESYHALQIVLGLIIFPIAFINEFALCQEGEIMELQARLPKIDLEAFLTAGIPSEVAQDPAVDTTQLLTAESSEQAVAGPRVLTQNGSYGTTAESPSVRSSSSGGSSSSPQFVIVEYSDRAPSPVAQAGLFRSPSGSTALIPARPVSESARALQATVRG